MPNRRAVTCQEHGSCKKNENSPNILRIWFSSTGDRNAAVGLDVYCVRGLVQGITFYFTIRTKIGNGIDGGDRK
jgi:hypothetical protein